MTSRFFYFNLEKNLDHWFSTGGPWSTGEPQHVSRVGHGRLRTLKMGLYDE